MGESGSAGLQLPGDTGHDIEYQRREWIAQRIGWTVMALLVVAALVGLLGGSGWFAIDELDSPNGTLSLRYHRMEHYHDPTELELEVAPEAVENGELRIWVDDRYARGLEIEGIIPEPDQVQIEPERVVYVFLVGQPTAPLTIQMAFQHGRFWRQSGELGLVGGDQISFNHFVFP